MNAQYKQARGSHLVFRSIAAAALAALLAGCSLLDVKVGDEDSEGTDDVGTPGATSASSVKAGETILTAAKTAIGQVVSGEIKEKGPSNFFYFANAGKLRDIVTVRLENNSTTLRPHIRIYDDNKSKIKDGYDYTPGANIERSVSLDPGTGIYVEVNPFGTAGAYALSAVAQKAYDAFEPNDDSKNATTLKFGDSVEASLLDQNDKDWFHVTPATVGKVTVALENLSAEYRPNVTVYNTQKSRIVNKYDYTGGAGLDFNVDVPAGQDFYVEVDPWGRSGGYRLTVRAAVLAGDMAAALDEKGTISLYGVYFDTDKVFVRPESANTLAQVAELLKANPALRLEVAGHTDNTGTAAHNIQLSKGRAEAVVQTLVGQHGIEARRLVPKGYGDTRPVQPNDTASGKAKNRRVELRKI